MTKKRGRDIRSFFPKTPPRKASAERKDAQVAARPAGAADPPPKASKAEVLDLEPERDPPPKPSKAEVLDLEPERVKDAPPKPSEAEVAHASAPPPKPSKAEVIDLEAEPSDSSQPKSNQPKSGDESSSDGVSETKEDGEPPQKKRKIRKFRDAWLLENDRENWLVFDEQNEAMTCSACQHCFPNQKSPWVTGCQSFRIGKFFWRVSVVAASVFRLHSRFCPCYHPAELTYKSHLLLGLNAVTKSFA